jgi:membrane protein YdbS with pleckstrin-like domain
MEKQNTSSGMGIGMILFIVFLVLKLTDVINWSWWWVTSPLWIPLAAAAVIIGILGVIAIIIEKFSR